MQDSNRIHNGQVTVNDAPSKARLFRFCEKQIDHWVQDHVPGDAPIEFSVSFTEDGDSEQIACLTEIQCGTSIFRGCDLSHDTQEAFMHSLKRLQVAQIRERSLELLS